MDPASVKDDQGRTFFWETERETCEHAGAESVDGVHQCMKAAELLKIDISKAAAEFGRKWGGTMDELGLYGPD